VSALIRAVSWLGQVWPSGPPAVDPTRVTAILADKGTVAPEQPGKRFASLCELANGGMRG
jgi:hypothetical protein